MEGYNHPFPSPQYLNYMYTKNHFSGSSSSSNFNLGEHSQDLKFI